MSAVKSLDSNDDLRGLQRFIQELPAAILLLDQDCRVVTVSKQLTQKLHKYQRELVVGQLLSDVFPEMSNVSFRDNQDINIEVEGFAQQIKIYTWVTDCQHVVLFQEEQNSSILQLVLDCIPARVFWKDRLGRFLGCNNLFAQDCNLGDSNDLIGKCDFDFFPEAEARNYVQDDREVMASGEPKLNIEESQTHVNGETIWLQTNKVPIRNQAGEVIGLMGSYADITERKKYQELIEHQARYDHLTGLRNRFALQILLSDLQQRNLSGGLLFLDLDYFKTINDSLGHTVGDEILKMVAQRLVDTVAQRGVVVRLGGDEFSVLCVKEVGQEDILTELTSLAEELRVCITKPYEVQRNCLEIGVSIGISHFEQGSSDWKIKLDEADMAMYEAKSAGRNSIVVFHGTMRQRVDYKHKLQSKLRNACSNNEIFLMIQPQYNTHKKIIGGEALLRWKNPELGMVSPAEFIPVSEQAGIIFELGDWVLRRAFALVKRWSQDLPFRAFGTLAVNVSPRQFQQADFVPKIESLLREYQISASYIELELTESLLLECESAALEKLEALYALGFSVAIDDFGTGYSCLAYLGKIPFGKLKVDRSFVSNATSNKRQAAIIETIISMTQQLEVGLIAEGVETVEQLDYLTEAGCYEFQGYYFSRPIAVAEFERLLEKEFSPTVNLDKRDR